MEAMEARMNNRMEAMEARMNDSMEAMESRMNNSMEAMEARIIYTSYYAIARIRKSFCLQDFLSE